MKKFELWLDESGDFENDRKKASRGKSPSLSGGLLIENNSFGSAEINYVIPEDFYHSVESGDAFDRFIKIAEKLYKNRDNRIVVFSNRECIMILDNNLTYLNILSEGILQLIRHLKAQYGEIFLKVIIANRVNTTTGRDPRESVVSTDEYAKRLKEKILMEGFRVSISEKEWSLENASARRDKRLMAADIVCNTILTRNAERKFSEEERRYINEVYNDPDKAIIFSVFQSVFEKNFTSNLMENKIGEAVANICLSEDKELIGKCFSLLRKNYGTCGTYDVVFQYRFIEAYIEYYINVVRDFKQCLVLLENLLEFFVPILNEYGPVQRVDYAMKLELDIKFYMLTVYTHLGNDEETEKLEKECDPLIKSLPPSLDTVNYCIKYDIRKLNGHINSFDFASALAEADELVEKCRGVKEAIDLVSDGESHYEELGKALGTRLQIKAFLTRFNRDYYDSAKEDSDEAIKNFVMAEDKCRQYLYRVHLETEAGVYDEALKYLKMALAEDMTVNDNELWKKTKSQSVFCIAAYVRLMAEGAKNNWKMAKRMFDQLNQDGYISSFLEKSPHNHPAEIIIWKYASYCALAGMNGAKDKYFKKAIECCYEFKDLTLNVIGLAIDFEYHATLLSEKNKETKNHLKAMCGHWELVREKDNNNILTRLFGDVDFKSEDPRYFMNAGRKVTY